MKNDEVVLTLGMSTEIVSIECIVAAATESNLSVKVNTVPTLEDVECASLLSASLPRRWL